MQVYRKIDKNTFLKFIAERNVSLRSLGRNSNVSDRTIRQALSDGFISISSAINVCSCLECTFDEAFGKDSSEEWTKITNLFTTS